MWFGWTFTAEGRKQNASQAELGGITLLCLRRLPRYKITPPDVLFHQGCSVISLAWVKSNGQKIRVRPEVIIIQPNRKDVHRVIMFFALFKILFFSASSLLLSSRLLQCCKQQKPTAGKSPRISDIGTTLRSHPERLLQPRISIPTG